MAESLEVGSLEHGGSRTSVELEEGQNFRRITIRRYRLMFGEYREQGRVHIFMDEIDLFREFLDTAEWWGVRVGNAGLEVARREFLDGKAS